MAKDFKPPTDVDQSPDTRPSESLSLADFQDDLRTRLREHEASAVKTLRMIALHLRIPYPRRGTVVEAKLHSLARSLAAVPANLHDAEAVTLAARCSYARVVVLDLLERLEERAADNEITYSVNELVGLLSDGGNAAALAEMAAATVGRIGADARHGGVILPSTGPWAELEGIGFKAEAGPRGRVRVALPEHWSFEPINGMIAYVRDERGIRRLTVFHGGRVEECVLRDVGARMAEDVVFAKHDTAPSLPPKWPTLTVEERASLRAYLAALLEKGKIAGKLYREHERALALLALAEGRGDDGRTWN